MDKIIGIVGNGENKFTEHGKQIAQLQIRKCIVENIPCTITSGDSPLKGIDYWTRLEAIRLNQKFDPKTPNHNHWLCTNSNCYGYKNRNIDIAKSNIVYILVADRYPNTYTGERFDYCYHCHVNNHIKSGGCWTGNCAIKLGNKAIWIVIRND